MKLFFVLLLLSFTSSLCAQKEIKLADVKNHVGDSVKVEGIIYGIKVFTDDDKNPTLSLINLGADYPNQLLSIAAYPASYKNTSKVFPGEAFKGHIAIIYGKIELYKGKPQIVIHSPDQLHIVSADVIVVPKQ